MQLAWFLFGPAVLAGVLRWRVAAYRNIRWAAVVGYLALMCLVAFCGISLIAHVARSRVLASTVPVVAWFLVGWHLAWLTWLETVGRAGERWVRLARLQRRRQSVSCQPGRWLAFGRVVLTLLVFLPALLGMILTYRCKWGSETDPLNTLGLPFETVRIKTRDGLTLDGWFVPDRRASRTVLIFHGAGANKGNFIWFLKPLAGRGYNLALIDSRAHGDSDGWRTTWGVREQLDVQAAVQWLKRERPAQARKIVGLGSSQGAMAVALAAANETRMDAIVLDSPFVSHRRWAHDYADRVPIVGPWAADYMLRVMSAYAGVDFLASSALPALASLGDRPVMVIHGGSDSIVGSLHAEALFSAVRGPRELWRGPGEHSNIATADPVAYGDHVMSFLGRVLGPP